MNLIENFVQDLRFGLRLLRRSLGFSLLAILCLILGIGANSAVFSWIEGILFRPYPLVAHQERLVAISGTSPDEPRGTALSWPDFVDLQHNCTLCETIFVSKISGTTLSIGERAERATGSIVSANYFDAIDVHPILGRGFVFGEDVGQRSHPVAVISYQLWQSRFGGDPQIVGKTQRFDGVVHTIVGVAPEGFYGTFVGWAMNFWVPASMEDLFEGGGYKLDDRGSRWIESYARLKPGVTIQEAQQEVSAIGRRIEADYPTTNRGRSFRLWPLWATPFNNAGTLLPTLEIMLAVVAFVLLIACANVGNLLLVRSLARRHEISVRLAIGAARWRIWKQLFAEGFLLSSFGATGGLLVAYWCRHLLVLLYPARGGVRMHLPGELDWRVFVLSAAVCIVSTILLGSVPAIQTGKIDLAQSLKMDAGGVLGGRGRARIRSGLILVQISLSFILVVACGLLLQSLLRVRTANPGFITRSVQFTALDLVSSGYDTNRAQTFQDTLIDRVRALPGVESAAFARLVPLSYVSSQEAPIAIDSYTPPPDESPMVEYNEVDSDFFATLGIPLVSGREFSRGDNEKSAPVAVINETMAVKFWKDRIPLGDRMQMKGRSYTIIGIAKDAKYDSVRENSRPFFYLSTRQSSRSGSVLFVRTSLPPGAMARALAREVHNLDPNLAPYEVITMKEQLDRSTSSQMVAVELVAVLGGLALLLATIGLYGVMSYAVSQSTSELGMRMALGAGVSDLLRLVLGRGLTLTVAGVFLGAAASLALTRLLGELLYQVSPRDPLAFGAAFAVMGVASAAACLVPAWRATRTDPVCALRAK